MGSTANNNPLQKLTTSDFAEHPGVKDCLTNLKQYFSEKKFVVSDVIDDKGLQYVNLVQKGGGVLGVALVGYTYVLEQMGIRFLRLAGTSAGAINTALLSVIGKKTEAKSEQVLKAICGLDFFSLVDGHPVARWLIKTFITHKRFGAQARGVITTLLGVLGVLLVGDIALLGLQNHYFFLSLYTKAAFVLTGFYLLLLGAGIAFVANLLKRLKNSGFGINPGDTFYDWIKARLEENGVTTVAELNEKASERPAGLRLRPDNPGTLDELCIDVTFITSELVTQNKIEFPKMYHLFRSGDDNPVHPAGFIRASMSIPLFFESYYINDIRSEADQIKTAWWETFGEKCPPAKARFVDGGILSNFPINIFYNKDVITPRLPSFGIDLDDTKPGEKDPDASQWTFAGFVGRMFNTIRFYYDKDFQIKNRVLQKGIGSIPLFNYNWLNFFLSDKDKIDMFVLGAQAAAAFLKKFDWGEFKKERASMQMELIPKTQPPGNG